MISSNGNVCLERFQVGSESHLKLGQMCCKTPLDINTSEKTEWSGPRDIEAIGLPREYTSFVSTARVSSTAPDLESTTCQMPALPSSIHAPKRRNVCRELAFAFFLRSHFTASRLKVLPPVWIVLRKGARTPILSSLRFHSGSFDCRDRQ
jgi:hypothetical protein